MKVKDDPEVDVPSIALSGVSARTIRSILLPCVHGPAVIPGEGASISSSASPGNS